MKKTIILFVLISMGLWANNIEDLSGIYASDILGKVNVTKKAPGSYLATADHSSYKLTENKNHTYSVKYRFLGFIPISAGEMKKIKIYRKGKYIFVNQDGENRRVAIKAHATKISQAWKDREGTYVRINKSKKNEAHVEKFIAKVIDGYFVLKIHTPKGIWSVIVDIKDDNHGIIMSPNKDNRKKVNAKNKIFEINGSIYKKVTK